MNYYLNIICYKNSYKQSAYILKATKYTRSQQMQT